MGSRGHDRPSVGIELERRVAAASTLLLALTGSACDGSASSDGATAAASGAGGGAPRACDAEPERTGEATYYDFADGSGNCSFDPSPNDLMIGAMNHVDYAGSAACGACVRLAGPNGGITIRVVDQ